MERFGKVYDKFLNETGTLNWRLFVARKCGIPQVERLPERIGQIAAVSLDDVSLVDTSVDELVVLQREASEVESDHWSAEFRHLDPRAHYRGKFALMFFKRWLGLLVEERTVQGSTWFGDLGGDGMKPRGYFEAEVLATKSRLPDGLEDFLSGVPTPISVH